RRVSELQIDTRRELVLAAACPLWAPPSSKSCVLLCISSDPFRCNLIADGADETDFVRKIDIRWIGFSEDDSKNICGFAAWFNNALGTTRSTMQAARSLTLRREAAHQ